MNPGDFFQCPGDFLIEKPAEQSVEVAAAHCRALVDHLTAPPPVPVPPDTGLDWLPTSWMGWLWGQWWTGTYWTVTMVVVAIGVIVAGFLVTLAKKDSEVEAAFFVTFFTTLAVGVAWPLLAIAAPFVILLGVLFFAGSRVCHKLGLASKWEPSS